MRSYRATGSWTLTTPRYKAVLKSTIPGTGRREAPTKDQEKPTTETIASEVQVSGMHAGLLPRTFASGGTIVVLFSLDLLQKTVIMNRHPSGLPLSKLLVGHLTNSREQDTRITFTLPEAADRLMAVVAFVLRTVRIALWIMAPDYLLTQLTQTSHILHPTIAMPRLLDLPLCMIETRLHLLLAL